MFDIFTLIAILALTHLRSTTSLAVVWYVNKSMPGVREWTIGRLLVTIAMIVVAMRVHIPLAWSVIVGTGLLMIGYYVVLVGFRNFMGRKPYSHTPFILLFIVFVSLMSYFVIPEDNLPGRAIVAVTYTIIYSLLVIRTVWPREIEDTNISCKLMAGIFTFHGAFYLFLLTLSFAGLSGSKFMESSLGTQSILIEGIAFSVLTGMTFITMTTEHLQQDLKRHAEIDPLTGTYNRRAFYSLAEHAFARQRRDKDDLSLICLDLDHFKKVNDAWGHNIGDQVLRAAVNIVSDCKREQDILARFGGEEFIILMPATPQSDAAHVAERMRHCIEQATINVGEQALSITISLGVASIDKRAAPRIDSLIANADKALYLAKQGGRNGVVVYAAREA